MEDFFGRLGDFFVGQMLLFKPFFSWSEMAKKGTNLDRCCHLQRVRNEKTLGCFRVTRGLYLAKLERRQPRQRGRYSRTSEVEITN